MSFGFLESSAVFTYLSFFTVFTAGLTKQFSFMFCALSTFSDFLSLFNSFSASGCSSVILFLPGFKFYVDFYSVNSVVFVEQLLETLFYLFYIFDFRDILYIHGIFRR